MASGHGFTGNWAKEIWNFLSRFASDYCYETKGYHEYVDRLKKLDWVWKYYSRWNKVEQPSKIRNDILMRCWTNNIRGGGLYYRSRVILAGDISVAINYRGRLRLDWKKGGLGEKSGREVESRKDRAYCYVTARVAAASKNKGNETRCRVDSERRLGLGLGRLGGAYGYIRCRTVLLVPSRRSILLALPGPSSIAFIRRAA